MEVIELVVVDDYWKAQEQIQCEIATGIFFGVSGRTERNMF